MDTRSSATWIGKGLGSESSPSTLGDATLEREEAKRLGAMISVR